jgi:hypothetical protein
MAIMIAVLLFASPLTTAPCEQDSISETRILQSGNLIITPHHTYKVGNSLLIGWHDGDRLTVCPLPNNMFMITNKTVDESVDAARLR